MNGNGYKIGEMVGEAALLLRRENIERAVHEANLIMGATLGTDIAYVFARHHEYVDEHIKEQYFEYVELRKKGKPFQYIISRAEFMSLDFFVNENVLIPRGDTETAVEHILKLMGKKERVRVLDLCTGSGCIAVSVAHYCTNARVVGADISPEAIGIAKRNARTNGVDSRIIWVVSDLFEQIEGKFDIIISNPPYLSGVDMEDLQREVAYEPEIALYGGKSGFDFYNRIVEQSVRYMEQAGSLVLEVGLGQFEYVAELVGRYFEKVEVIKDLSGIERVVAGSRPVL